MQFLMNVLLVSGVEDREAESGGEGDHRGVQSAGIEEIGTEKENEKGRGSGKEIDIEKGKEKEDLDAQEGLLQRGNSC